MEKAPKEIVAANLAALMKRNRAYRSQPLLANKSGIAQSTVGRILRSETNSGNDTLQALAAVFKLTAADLLDPKLLARIDTTATAQQAADIPVTIDAGPLESSLLNFFRSLDPKRQARLVSIAAEMYTEQAAARGSPSEKSSAGTHG